MAIAFLFGAVFFAMVGYVGVLLGISVTLAQRLPGSPEPSEPPILWIVAGCALVGALITMRGILPGQLALIALVCMSLSAIWCTDVRYGIVPDAFTLGPLALIVAIATIEHRWWMLASAALVFIPFAIAAVASRGRGMGWGDVKLVALGGAVLGAQSATLAFALSCLAAAAYAHLRGKPNMPIAFAPYLIAGIAVALPAGTLL